MEVTRHGDYVVIDVLDVREGGACYVKGFLRVPQEHEDPMEDYSAIAPLPEPSEVEDPDLLVDLHIDYLYRGVRCLMFMDYNLERVVVWARWNIAPMIDRGIARVRLSGPFPDSEC